MAPMQRAESAVQTRAGMPEPWPEAGKQLVCWRGNASQGVLGNEAKEFQGQSEGLAGYRAGSRAGE